MENRRPYSSPPKGNLELIGDGPSFRETLCTMLSEAKCFTDFSQADIEVLARHMKAFRAHKDTTIIREGERNGFLCVLVEGHVNVYKEDGQGNVKPLSSIMKGRIFGEISLIDELPSSASVIADAEATIIMMTGENFRRCIHDHPALGVRLLHLIARMLSARLRATSGQLIDYVHV